MSRLPGATLLMTRSPIVDHALGHVLEAREHPERGRLPAAGRADEHEELAVGDVDRQIVHRDHVVEALRHVLVRDGRHQSPASSLGEHEKRAVARNVYATVRVRKGITAAATPGDVERSRTQPERDGRVGPCDREARSRNAPSRRAGARARRRRASRGGSRNAPPQDERVERQEREWPERRSRRRTERARRPSAGAEASGAASSRPAQPVHAAGPPTRPRTRSSRSGRRSPRSGRAPRAPARRRRAGSRPAECERGEHEEHERHPQPGVHE